MVLYCSKHEHGELHERSSWETNGNETTLFGGRRRWQHILVCFAACLLSTNLGSALDYNGVARGLH